MAKSALGLHAVHMRRLGPNPDRSLASSAHELQQAAGTLQSHAARADAVPTYGITLAHVEEAVDRLAASLDQMANAVAEWCGESDAVVEESALPPEARALRWHLQAAATDLRTAEAACCASRDWTRRLRATVPDGGYEGRLARRAASRWSIVGPRTRNVPADRFDAATGIRTRVSAVRGRRPRPLDDGGAVRA